MQRRCYLKTRPGDRSCSAFQPNLPDCKSDQQDRRLNSWVGSIHCSSRMGARRMFVRNAWYVAAALAEIGDKPLARTILNEPIVLFKNGRGEICALEDRCCHRGAPLALGEPTEAGIRCGYHGMEFNREGACTFIPGQTIIPKRARVKSYPVVAKTDYVWIWTGQAEKADPAEIADY